MLKQSIGHTWKTHFIKKSKKPQKQRDQELEEAKAQFFAHGGRIRVLPKTGVIGGEFCRNKGI